MNIIPVVDLLDGIVVHAKRGDRAKYMPIQSKLTPSSQALDILTALLGIYPFKHLYIADLNAIQKLNADYKNNFSVINAIKQRYPELELWVDAGISNNAELNYWKKLDVRLILGSENFVKIDDFNSLDIPANDFILSLDFMPNGYQGPKELLNNTNYWPQNVIVMSLANVGSNSGANNELIHEMIAQAKGHNLVAAGGIRNYADLIDLKNMGIHGALIATSLHQQQISRPQFEEMSK